MSYALTFDASAKIKTGSAHATNWARHVFRDVDEARGIHVQHTNENIVPEQTHLNVSMIRDMDSGEWVAASSSQEILDALDERLSTVTKPPRANAVVMRPLVLQMGAQWYRDNNPDWRENGLNEASLKLHKDMTEFAESFAERKGDVRNLLAVSTHLDETNPQLQFAFTPVTNDGRLSQKDWFSSPSQLRRVHREFRQFMIERGYDIEPEPTKRSREHLDSQEFGRLADRARDGVAEIEARSEELDERMAEVLRREHTLREGEADLAAGNDDLFEREAEIEARENAAKTALARAQAMQAEAQRLRDEAEAEKAAIAVERANAEKLERVARQDREAAATAREMAENITKQAVEALERVAKMQKFGAVKTFLDTKIHSVYGEPMTVGEMKIINPAGKYSTVGQMWDDVTAPPTITPAPNRVPTQHRPEQPQQGRTLPF